MNKRRRLFILLAFVFLGIFFGFQAGILAKGDETTRFGAYHGEEPSQSNQADVVQDGSPAGLRLLVVGVDCLTGEEKPRLRSVWYAVYDPSQTKLIWYGYYPAVSPNAEDINRDLESHFSIQPGQKLSLEFQAFMQARHKLLWNNAVMLDDQQVGQLIDILDGIKLQGQAINSRQALAGLKVAAGDVRTARIFQTEIIRGFCERRDELGAEAAAVSEVSALITSRILPPPPAMWEDGIETASFSELFQGLLKSKGFLPCEISDFP
jgi:hypothetical protein